MTETSPLARVAWPQERMRDWDDERADRRACAPRPGCRCPASRSPSATTTASRCPSTARPWATCTCAVRGLSTATWTAQGAEHFTDDGWFNTGDVAIGSPDGYFVIADRTKDLIKSGGEWISSVDMEAAIMAHARGRRGGRDRHARPEVAGAAAGRASCASAGAEIDLDAVRAHLESRVRELAAPDRVEIIDEVPETALGKFDKKVLRARFTE